MINFLKNRNMEKIFKSFLLLSIFIIPFACTPSIVDEFVQSFGEQVVVGTDDKTPPEVSLVFYHPATGNKIILKSGDQPMKISIKKSDYFYVVGVAEDPQGVKEISVFPSTSIDCKSEG